MAAQIKCPDLCVIKIFRNQKMLSETRSTVNEAALTKISADQAIPGFYEWEYTSETKNHRAQFTIQDYSAEALTQAIEKGFPIEIP